MSPRLLFTILLLSCLTGCATEPPDDEPVKPAPAAQVEQLPSSGTTGPRVQGVNLNDPVAAIPHDQPIILSAAKNEVASFAVQTSWLPAPRRNRAITLRLKPLQLADANGQIDASNFSTWQILPMPIDLNRAGFVRHTGLSATQTLLPRALLPTACENGVANLSTSRDPARPTDPSAKANLNDPLLFWVDLQIPPEARPGEYTATCDVMETDNPRPIASVPVRLTVHDFVLPDERHLVMTSVIAWESLKRLYPRFETVEARLMSRNDSRYAPAVQTLDQLVRVAQSHRLQLLIPKLQPTVKWPVNRPPVVSWDEYDSLVAPWLKGDVFPDKAPFGYWTIPTIDNLDHYPAQSKAQYWSEAAAHFDQFNWLERSAVVLEKQTPGRATARDSVELSVEAQQVLSVHPRIRVTVPLEDSQLALAGTGNTNLIDPKSAERIIAASAGLVSSAPTTRWPADAPRPKYWLRTDLPGLIPYVGAGGDERDVRLWAWLAFLRNATIIQWGGALPRVSTPQQPADPNDLVWFYPGSWFGVDEPVPTIQLKWLRTAQQDYEYLWLARQRGQQINAVLMARLITKPVEIQPSQPEDPTYALMSGTTDSKAWTDAKSLLARNILLREVGRDPDPQRDRELNIQTLHWATPQERPTIMARSTQWQFDPTAGTTAPVSLRLGIDIYNASDSRPADNPLQWTEIPSGWIVRPQPIAIPALATYRVQRFTLDAQVELNKVVNAENTPVKLTFTNGFNNQPTSVKMVIPVAASDRHPPGLLIDGSLEDWTPDDQIQNGPLVEMFDRPALQTHQTQLAATNSAIYSGWSDDNFYVAFRLEGLSTQDVRATRNFVAYQFRRAWGEDLCQLLVQPIYSDTSLGPVLHIVCKPNGSWIERKGDARMLADPWQAFQGAPVRYMGTIDGQTWRGEVAIPWGAMDDPAKGRPIALRFNFSQHSNQTGQSASWCGPVDYGRDDAFMGLIWIREKP